MLCTTVLDTIVTCIKSLRSNGCSQLLWFSKAFGKVECLKSLGKSVVISLFIMSERLASRKHWNTKALGKNEDHQDVNNHTVWLCPQMGDVGYAIRYE